MPKSLLEVIAVDPVRDRAPVVRGLFAKDGDGPVNREGGSRKAGIIEGASVVAVGEALGHGMWIDQETVDQVVEFGNAFEQGVKVRFTHPSMSGDGLGSYLGRAKNFTSGDGQAYADIHFSPTSRSEKNPDGDLGGYVMDLADDDPEVFGMSIVFDHDPEAESEFEADHQEEVTREDYRGRKITETVFVSPDKNNEGNFFHVRLAALHGADFVDEPAANPDGLFHRGPTSNIINQAEATLEFALGLTDNEPSSEATGGLSAGRLKGFLSRFLDGRGIALSVQQKEKISMAEKTEEAVETVEDSTVEAGDSNDETTETKTEETSEVESSSESEESSEVGNGGGELSMNRLNEYVEAFGAENGVKYLREGVSYQDALKTELAAANKKLATREPDRGEDKPVDEFTEGSDGEKAKKKEAFNRSQGGNLPIKFAS